MTTHARAARALTVRDVTVRFGAVEALSGVSFAAAPGTIHAVIGPNGAGKSTLFNVLSGVYRPTSGSVDYGAHRISQMRPHKIAELGVARTFQNIVLSHGSVAENILLGRHHLMSTGFLGGALALPGSRRETLRHLGRVREIARFLGIDEQLESRADELSYGDQKRVELARALAVEPELLLLDEPVAGMNATEKSEMTHTIRQLHGDLDLTLVLVEHDMAMVMDLADHCTVLDFGRVIADGSPDHVQRHPEVVRAYLGTAAEKDAAVVSAAISRSS